MLAAALLCASVAAYLAALGRLRAHEQATAGPAWWFGYARDGVNLAGAIGNFSAFALGGFDGPVALMLALTLLLFTNGIDWFLGKHLAWPRAMRAALPVAAGAGAALLLLRDRALPSLDALLGAVGPR